MKILLIILIVMLFVMVFVMLYRVIKGPSAYERMNGIGVISADVIVLLILFGYLDERPEMYIDIAIAYAILGFICNITLAKYLEGRAEHHDD